MCQKPKYENFNENSISASPKPYRTLKNLKENCIVLKKSPNLVTRISISIFILIFVILTLFFVWLGIYLFSFYSNVPEIIGYIIFCVIMAYISYYKIRMRQRRESIAFCINHDKVLVILFSLGVFFLVCSVYVNFFLDHTYSVDRLIAISFRFLINGSILFYFLPFLTFYMLRMYDVEIYYIDPETNELIYYYDPILLWARSETRFDSSSITGGRIRLLKLESGYAYDVVMEFTNHEPFTSDFFNTKEEALKLARLISNYMDIRFSIEE